MAAVRVVRADRRLCADYVSASLHRCTQRYLGWLALLCGVPDSGGGSFPGFPNVVMETECLVRQRFCAVDGFGNPYRRLWLVAAVARWFMPDRISAFTGPAIRNCFEQGGSL